MINKYGMCEIGVTTVNDLLARGDQEATKIIQKNEKLIKQILAQLVGGVVFTGEEFKDMVRKYQTETIS